MLAAITSIIYRLTEEGLDKGLLNNGIVPDLAVNPEDTFRELDTDEPDPVFGYFGVGQTFRCRHTNR